MGALESASPDPHDAATTTCTPPPGRDYTKFLDAGALKGARIGIPRAFFYDKYSPPGSAATTWPSPPPALTNGETPDDGSIFSRKDGVKKNVEKSENWKAPECGSVQDKGCSVETQTSTSVL